MTQITDIPWSEIKGIFLDLDDTLYSYPTCNTAGKEAVFSLLSERLGVSNEDVKNAYMGARERVHRDLDGTGSSHSRFLYIQKAIEALTRTTNIQLTQEAHTLFWDSYFSKMELRPGVLDFLQKAKEQKISIAIVTDLTTEIQFKKIDHLGISDLIDVVVSSEEAGEEKHAPTMYQLTLEKTGLSPENIIMIGDSLRKDVETPKSLGIHALHLNEENASRLFLDLTNSL